MKKEKSPEDHEFKMDVKMFPLPQPYFPVDTRRRSNVNTTSYNIVRCRVDVETNVVCLQGHRDMYSLKDR